MQEAITLQCEAVGLYPPGHPYKKVGACILYAQAVSSFLTSDYPLQMISETFALCGIAVKHSNASTHHQFQAL
jgi:hypothetical protein